MDDLAGRALSVGDGGPVVHTDPATGLTHGHGGHPNPTRAEGPRAGLPREGLHDNAGDIIPGGDAPILQIEMVADGSMVDAANGARDALHTGARPGPDVDRLVATVDVVDWVPEVPSRPGCGVLLGQVTGLVAGDGTQSSFLRVVFGPIAAFGTVGFEVGDGQGAGGVPYTVLERAAAPALAGADVPSVEPRLEVSGIRSGAFEVAVPHWLEGAAAFAALAPGGFALPPGVPRDVLTGEHTIMSDDAVLASGAGDGDSGAGLRAIDVNGITVEGFADPSSEAVAHRVNAGSDQSPGAAQGTIAAIDGGPTGRARRARRLVRPGDAQRRHHRRRRRNRQRGGDHLRRRRRPLEGGPATAGAAALGASGGGDAAPATGEVVVAIASDADDWQEARGRHGGASETTSWGCASPASTCPTAPC